MKYHETGEPGVIKCAKNNCKQTFTSVSDLKKHMDNHESLFIQQNASKLNAKEFQCQLCGKIIKGRRSDLHKHVEKHETDTPGVIKCIFWGCKQTFTSTTDLKQHTAKHWDISLRPFPCDFPQCNYATKNKYCILRHQRLVHSSKLCTCDMCGKQFKHLDYVAQHVVRCLQNQMSAENPNSTVVRPKTTEESQEMVCKEEIEEVVFD
jgi:hypothetical protein